MGGSRGADWTGYGWLAEEDRNRRKTEEKRKKGRKEGALGDFSRKTRGKEEVKERKGGEDLLTKDCSWFRYDSNLFCFSRFELFSSVPSQCVDSFDIRRPFV